VRKVTSEHGGTVRARNAPDGGAVVSLALPRRSEGRDANVELMAPA
jgi:signal transduction histidine kinase